MSKRMQFSIVEASEAAAAEHEGPLICFFRPAGVGGRVLIGLGEALDARMDGQLARALATAGEALGDATVIRAPHGLKAEILVALSVGDGTLDESAARKLGAAAIGAVSSAKADAARVELSDLWPAGSDGGALAAAFAYAVELKGYRFDLYKSEPGDGGPSRFLLAGAGDASALERAAGLAEGVLLTRDLVNEPANILHPEAFADRIAALAEGTGLEIEILDEPAMEKLGMRALLAVGRGSRKASRLAIMRWSGGDAKTAPIALVGKGVCFDTGGISLKPAAGMEEMTMDMGGAATVVGAMLALARRKAAANVVGIVGLVENMPDGDAQRPGDVVKSMAGKTIEVINTDAEGRLVLCDALWHAQEAFKPRAIIDLATLTGAVIIALGHYNAGLFANEDGLAEALLSSAAVEDEGLWRLPLGKEYDQQLKSRIADMKNVGGRPAGSVTAAQFLQRFIKDGQAWAHLDIAGVASVKEATPLAPKGATGWGVATLVRYVETADA